MTATVDRSDGADAAEAAANPEDGSDAQPWYPDGPPRLADDGGDDGESPPGEDGGDRPAAPWWQRPLNIVAMLVTASVCFALIGWSVGADREQRHNDVDVGFLQDMRTHHEQATYMSLLYLSRPDTDPEIQTVAVSILQGQNIEIGRMIQLLRFFGAAEAANLDEPPMTWMEGMDHTDTEETGSTGETGSMDETESMGEMGHMDQADAANPDPDDVPFMPGMATEAELDQLSTLTGRAADELYVRLMIDHHLAGIEMANYAAEHGESPAVRSMADAMAHGQGAEVTELTNLIGAP